LIQRFFCLSSAAMQIALLSCTAAYAQGKPRAAENTVLPEVAVTASTARDSVEKSYRKMLNGVDLFEQKHAMAPAASLRFKLLPRHRDTRMDRIDLEILGDTVAIPLPVAADSTFSLVRDQKALDENAAVTPNRRARSMTWRTDIRTPGLPPNTRRLGDLRLECEVGEEAELISYSRSVFGAIANALSGKMDRCYRNDNQYLFFADHPLFSITLAAGARREVLPVDRMYAGASQDPELNAALPECDCEVLVDRTYYLPLGDRSWPDDTLVEFEYMDVVDDRHAG
jgi:hypothetical protein